MAILCATIIMAGGLDPRLGHYSDSKHTSTLGQPLRWLVHSLFLSSLPTSSLPLFLVHPVTAVAFCIGIRFVFKWAAINLREVRRRVYTGGEIENSYWRVGQRAGGNRSAFFSVASFSLKFTGELVVRRRVVKQLVFLKYWAVKVPAFYAAVKRRVAGSLWITISGGEYKSQSPVGNVFWLPPMWFAWIQRNIVLLIIKTRV